MDLSFEIGSSHIYSTDTNENLLEDANDGVDFRAQNDTNETVNEDKKDGVEACAQNDDRHGKLQDICQGRNHEICSDYSSNCINSLDNSSVIRIGSECIIRIEENISSDITIGEGPIGQNIKTNGKLNGISHAT